MSLDYRDIKSEQQWKASTGLSSEEFFALAKIFAETYTSAKIFAETSNEISGEILDSRKAYFSPTPVFNTCEDMLFFVLYSIRSGLSYDLLGVTFGIDTAEAFKNQSFILRILIKALERYHLDSCLN